MFMPQSPGASFQAFVKENPFQKLARAGLVAEFPVN
jgi:hypothetical protein